MYDLIIIGGGPAGSSAGIYAARKQLKTLIFAKEFVGQSVVSPNIQNWIGTISISGIELAESIKKHLLAYAGDFVEMREGENAVSIEKNNEGFLVTTDKDEKYSAKTILVATGSQRRRLTIPGSDKFEHKGVTYCATCDGPMFSDKDVVVIGGGNAGFETAAQLSAYAKSVTILDSSKDWHADAITIKKVLSDKKTKALQNTIPVEIKGDNFVSSIVVKNNDTGKISEIVTDGIFVEIGQIPATSFVKKIVKLTKNGSIKINPRTQQTSTHGIWAAGDCTDVLYKQNNIAVGDAVQALEDIFVYLKTK